MLLHVVRSSDLAGQTPESLSLSWRLWSLEVGLDLCEDRVYTMVWKDVIHSLMAVFKDYERARLVERIMIDAWNTRRCAVVPP